MADAIQQAPRAGTPAASGGNGGGFMTRLVSFYHQVLAELRKVTWPERAQVQQATIAILIFVLILGLVIWLMDLALQGVLVRLVPSLFGGS
jgi:preprotein translocase subunit SecE